jgi:nicotinamidase-related amidase
MTDATKRALVVIDAQNEYVTGGLQIEHPPVQTSLANIGLAMDAAHAAGVPVIVVQNRAPAAAPLFAHGTDGWQLHAVVANRHRDLWVEKTLPGALAETDIVRWTRQRGISTLSLLGYMTQNCVTSTAVEALQQGFAVAFLQDASGTVSYQNQQGFVSAQEMHKVYCTVLQSRFAAVCTTLEWMEGLKSGAALPRTTIYQSHANAMAHRNC